MTIAKLPGAAEALPAPDQVDSPRVQSYWNLVWWKFSRNRMAVIGGLVVLAFYVVCVLLPEFFAPYYVDRQSGFLEMPPQRPRLVDQDGNFHLRPFVYGYQQQIDPIQRRRTWVIDTSQRIPIRFFTRGESYQLWGVIESDWRLFGPGPDNLDAPLHIFGTDRLGRDMLSRIIYGGRLSLLLGLIGQLITLVLGSILGSASGFYGGAVDMGIQRLIEFLAAFPTIPLFMALAATIPPTVSPIGVYFLLTLILAFLGWGGLARQVRGMVLSLREREFVLAAQSFGTSDWKILSRHLIPNVMSHIVVIATLAIPSMILAETALSFLGLGLRAPLTSWGVLLHEAQGIRAIRFAPWVLLPTPFVILVVMAFNFLGDGLRDAMDPYTK